MNKTDNLNNQQLHSYARLLAAEAAIAAGVPETALMILVGTVEVHARRSGSWQVSLPGAAPGTAAWCLPTCPGSSFSSTWCLPGRCGTA
jgi:hypothetical protein